MDHVSFGVQCKLHQMYVCVTPFCVFMFLTTRTFHSRGSPAFVRVSQSIPPVPLEPIKWLDTCDLFCSLALHRGWCCMISSDHEVVLI